MSLWDVSSFWQIVPALSLVAVIVIFYWSRKIKSLNYEIVTDEPLFAISEEFPREIKVTYRGEDISGISLIVIRFFLNDGTEPIKLDDFVEPITVSFRSRVVVLNAELKDTDPSTINAKLISEQDKIIIEPLLLNKRDSITIKVLITGTEIRSQTHLNAEPYDPAFFNATEDIMLHYRIIGVKTIKNINKRLSKRIDQWFRE